ncbi:hypothetical protein DB41_DN00040 [Neochlamydia sp. TUME1]|nr:hypothetical protein DB41_DN00040 [Neochlamydia sp. TUME1]
MPHVYLSWFIPSLHQKTSYLNTFLTGMLFGFATWATYDLTNQATLKDWLLIATLVDVGWGSFLIGTISRLTLYFVSRFS